MHVQSARIVLNLIYKMKKRCVEQYERETTASVETLLTILTSILGQSNRSNEHNISKFARKMRKVCKRFSFEDSWVLIF